MNENSHFQNRCVGAVGLLSGGLVLAPWDAWAAATQSPAQNPVAGALFIAWGIAYVSRRCAIGGWLLYFYIQLYLSVLLSLLLLPTSLGDFRPSVWDSAQLYVLYLVSVVPVQLLVFAEAVAATILLVRRSEGNLRGLKRILIALSVASGVTLGIDFGYFSDSPAMFFDIITFIFAVIWLLYFSTSKRVRFVFIDRNWDYATFAPKRILSSEDKCRLRRRTIIASSVTFVGLLLLMGFSLGDKKPDAGIFFVPLFYAGIVALFAWYLPLRKRRTNDQPQPQSVIDSR